MGEEGRVPLEVRFLHEPSAAEGFVGNTLSSTVFRFFKTQVGWKWTVRHFVKSARNLAKHARHLVWDYITEIYDLTPDKAWGVMPFYAIKYTCQMCTWESYSVYGSHVKQTIKLAELIYMHDKPLVLLSQHATPATTWYWSTQGYKCTEYFCSSARLLIATRIRVYSIAHVCTCIKRCALSHTVNFKSDTTNGIGHYGCWLCLLCCYVY